MVVVVVFVDKVCHDDRVYKGHIKCEEEFFFEVMCIPPPNPLLLAHNPSLAHR
jgi:hypothetical protein